MYFHSFISNEILEKMTVSPFPESDGSSKNVYDVNSGGKLGEWLNSGAKLGELLIWEN